MKLSTKDMSLKNWGVLITTLAVVLMMVSGAMYALYAILMMITGAK